MNAFQTDPKSAEIKGLPPPNSYPPSVNKVDGYAIPMSQLNTLVTLPKSIPHQNDTNVVMVHLDTMAIDDMYTDHHNNDLTITAGVTPTDAGV